MFRSFATQCRSFGFLVPLIALSSTMIGCASEFDKQWSLAAKQPNGASDITGQWSGKWVSEGTGHSGGLKAVVVRNDSTDGYKSFFHATYFGIFHFDYTFDLPGQTDPNHVLTFKGEEDIGSGGGKYTYDGQVTPDRFHCNYRTKDDHGAFDMTRPK